MTIHQSYEECESANQLLSFNYLNEYMEQNKKKFTDIQMKILKIKDGDGKYTNLGYLLSDQNTKSIRVVIYNDDDMVDLNKKAEYAGCLLKQYFEILDVLAAHNRSRYTYVGPSKEDVWDYPEESLRQTLLNMIIHTDYEVKEPNVIKVFSDRIEFSSFGGLPNGIAYDDLFVGMSVPRNKNLANFFKNYELTSNFGLGIGIIRDAYNRSLAYPRIRVNDDIFMVTLPNQNDAFDNGGNQNVHLSLAETSKMLNVLDILKEKEVISRKEFSETLNISPTRTSVLLKHLTEKEVLATKELPSGSIGYTRPR